MGGPRGEAHRCPSIIFRLAPACDSPRFNLSIQKRSSLEPQGGPRSSRWHVSAGNCAVIRLEASVCDSTDSIEEHKDDHRSSHRLPDYLSMPCFGRKLCRGSFEGIGVRFQEIRFKNPKSILARATGCPRSSRGRVSTWNCAAIRLKASAGDSTRFS